MRSLRRNISYHNKHLEMDLEVLTRIVQASKLIIQEQVIFKNLDNDIIVLTGKISEAIIVPDSGSDGNVVTYDGNAEAYDSQASNVTFTNWTKNASYSSFFVFNKSFITIKNIKIDWNYTSEMGSTPDNIYGIKIQDASNVIIESVDISQTHNGIGIFDNSYKVKVIKSKIYTIAESGIYITKYYSSFYPHDITIGGNKENGNLIKNCTYKTKWDNNNVGYDIRLSPDVENIIISHNHLYADKQGYGMSGILVHSSKNILIEYNTIHGHKCYMHRHGISIKGEVVSQVASNIVIRYNKIFDEQSDNNAYAEYSGGMMFSGNWENIYIYGNYIFSSGGGINVNYALWTSPATHSDGVDPKNINIWGNIISDTSHWGILIAGSSVGKDTIRQIAVLNNTLYRVAISADNQNWAAVSNVLNDQQTDNLLIKNNIIIDSRVNTNDKFAIFASKTNDTFIENNTAYIIDSIDSNIENIDKIF